MTHLLKKALKGSHLIPPRSHYPPSLRSHRPVSPILPPPPDLSSLTPDEISTLDKVIERQEQFETEQERYLSKIKRHLELYEETVRRQANGKGKLKHIDLRLCRLCFKTKFADGIGRICYDCRKRVCQRCGGYTQSKWDEKKNKYVRGRWRCNMCQLRREFYCKTGVWYHGLRAKPAFNRQSLNKKTKQLETESSDTEGTRSVSDNNTDIEVDSCHEEEHVEQSQQKIMHTRGRRRSMPVFRTELVLDSDDNESENEKEIRSRSKRPHRRKHSKKIKHVAKNNENSDSDDAVSFQQLKDNLDKCAPRSTYSPGHRLHANYCDRRKLSDDSHKRGLSLFSDGNMHDKSSRRSSYTYLKYPDSQYHSSSSSLASDTRAACMSHPISPEKHRLYPGSNFKDVRSSNNDNSYRRERVSQSRATIDTNFLVPDFNRQHRSCSSGSNSSVRSVLSALTDCDRPEINQITFTQDYISSLEPREILLYRDTADESRRYAGLGMHVMFGKSGYKGKLGAFVSAVEKDGPADSYGIREGDQILLWNGKSLMGTTFEESKDILNHFSDFVQLLVVHHTMSFSDDDLCDEDKEENDEGIHIVSTLMEETMPNPPSSLDLKRPKRRLLPKTPVEIKKEERQYSGRITMSTAYTAGKTCLSVTLVKAENLIATDSLRHAFINPVAFVHLLPNRGVYPPYESIPQCRTSNPFWNEQFNIHDVGPEEIQKLALEVTVWSIDPDEHVFLGEVLIDLVDMALDNEIKTYELQDHDENSSPLPVRKRKESASDATTNSWTSPMTSTMDYSSLSTSPVVLSSPSHNKDLRSTSDAIAHAKYRMMFMQDNFKHDTNREKRNEVNSTYSVPNSPQLSPCSISEENFFYQVPGEHRGSISKVKKRMSHVISKVSSMSMSSERKPTVQDKLKDRVFGRSQSVTDVSARPRNHSSPTSRKLLGNDVSGSFDMRRSLADAESSASFFSDEMNRDKSCHDLPSPNRQDPDGDDITSMLGPSQVPPKPSSETSVCGNIRLGFFVSKGQLEIDVINASLLTSGQDITPPDTYAKAYLVGGSKVVQKKKTHVVKGTYEPFFRRKMKYSACNIHGRAIKVVIWARHGAFDKKESLGEAVIKLDGLDLMQHAFHWYKLFKSGATDFGSNESMNMW